MSWKPFDNDLLKVVWPKSLTLSLIFITGVFLLSAMANRYRLHKLKRVDQFVMMYGGLRGAVAFALALLIDKKVRVKDIQSVCAAFLPKPILGIDTLLTD